MKDGSGSPVSPTSDVGSDGVNRIGARIAEVIDRREQGNVSAAARLLGVSQTGLAKIYRGETSDPRADLLVRICEAYSVDPSWLLLGESRAEVTQRVAKADAQHLAVRILEAVAAVVDPSRGALLDQREIDEFAAVLAAGLAEVAENNR
jgi:transcriptional regulator with XRE-family HTH domain